MSKYGSLEVDVKVYESKDKEPKIKENGKVSLSIGMTSATIKLDGAVLFEKIAGRMGITYRDIDAYNRNDGLMYVMYNQSNTSDAGIRYDQVIIGEKLNAILQVESMKSFNEGFAQSERDENIAENVGMSAEDYLSIAKAAMSKVTNLKSAIIPTKTSTTSALKQLDADLASDIG